MLLGELPNILVRPKEVMLRGACVFASVNPKKGSADERLKIYLHSLSQAPGFKMMVRERLPIKDTCPHCKHPIERTVQKGVVADMITALFEGAISNSYDIALLVSNDPDCVPAIRFIQEHLHREVVHVGFKDGGTEIRTAAWGHISLDGAVAAGLVESRGNVPT